MKTSTLLAPLSIVTIGSIYIGLHATVVNAQVIDVGPQTGTYTGMTRGFWFEAPTNFTITGLGLPTEASTENFDISVLLFDAFPPFFPSSTTNFSTLFTSRNNVGSELLDVNINVSQGQIIGLLGSRGEDSINSYGQGGFTSNILGFDVDLNRLLMQEDLRINDPSAIGVSTENSSIGRILMEVETTTPAAVPEPFSVLGLLTVGALGAASLKRRQS